MRACVSAALLAGWRAFGRAAYLASAERALDVTWRRGLIFKGLMNCHGLGGNTWMQTHAYKMTGNATYLYRAIAFQTLAVTTPLLSEYGVMRVPRRSHARSCRAPQPRSGPSMSGARRRKCRRPQRAQSVAPSPCRRPA